MRRVAWGLIALVGLTGGAVAHGYWRGGVFIGPGGYGPPYGYAYQPPPMAGEGCYAGAWVCPLDRPAAVGEPCGCPTGQGTAWGRAR